jgi:hypothetical protein
MVDSWQTGQMVAIDQSLAELTLRIIAKTMYGIDLVDQTDKIGRLMKTILTIAEEQLGQFIVLPKWIPTRQHRRQAMRRSLALLGLLRGCRLLLLGIRRRRPVGVRGRPAPSGVSFGVRRLVGALRLVARPAPPQPLTVPGRGNHRVESPGGGGKLTR